MVGRIVDNTTLAPLRDGTVTVFATHSIREMDPIGPEVQVARDGSFRVQRLPEGLSVISLTAPGHSTRELKVWYDGTREVELGDLPLSRTQPLRATVILPQGHDPTQLVLLAEGIGAIPPTRFDELGQLLVPQASEGAFVFRIFDREGVGTTQPLISLDAWLRPGNQWDLTFNLSAGQDVTVALAPQSKSTTPLMAGVLFETPSGYVTWQNVPFDEEGRSETHGVPPGPAIVTAETLSEGFILITKVVDVPSSSEHPLTVELDLEPRPVTVRVVDTRGVPQQEVLVEVRALDYGGLTLGGEVTDGNGLCTFADLPREADTVTLVGPEAGVNEELPFSPPSRSNEILELVFDRSASVHLHITDEGVPQPTATVRLWNPERPDRVLSPGRQPDRNGYLTIPRLGPGTYELRAASANLWPVSMQIQATHEEKVVEVNIRRLGGLDVTFLDGQGAPLSNESIDLFFSPTQESVTAWIVDGKLFTGTTSTDSTGRLQLSGIPHGDYQWSHGGQGGILRVPIEETLKDVVQLR